LTPSLVASLFASDVDLEIEIDAPTSRESSTFFETIVLPTRYSCSTNGELPNAKRMHRVILVAVWRRF